MKAILGLIIIITIFACRVRFEESNLKAKSDTTFSKSFLCGSFKENKLQTVPAYKIQASYVIDDREKSRSGYSVNFVDVTKIITLNGDLTAQVSVSGEPIRTIMPNSFPEYYLNADHLYNKNIDIENIVFIVEKAIDQPRIKIIKDRKTLFSYPCKEAGLIDNEWKAFKNLSVD